MLNTNDSSGTADRFWLNSFEVVPKQHLIVHNGEETSINPRTMAVLMCLVERKDGYVSTQDLFDQIWPANHVSDNSVYKAINELRVIFGDTAEKPRFIESRPRRGYRLILKPGNHSSHSIGPITVTTPSRSWRVGISVSAALALLTTLLWFTIGEDESGVPLVENPDPGMSVAILRFRNIDENPELEYMAESIPASLGKALGYIAELKVVTPDDAPGLNVSSASDLEVQHVLEGSFYTVDEAIEVTATLYERASRDRLYTYRDSLPVDDVGNLEKIVTADLVPALEVHLNPGNAAEMESYGTKSVDAYLLLKRAWRHRLRGDWKSLEYAASLLRKAIAIDPGMVFSYGILAGILGDFSLLTHSPELRAELKAEVTAIKETVTRIDPTATNIDILFAETRLKDNSWHLLETQTREQILVAGTPHETDFNYLIYADLLMSAHLFREAAAYMELYAKFAPHNPWLQARRTNLVTITEGARAGIPMIEKTLKEFSNDPFRLQGYVTQLAIAGNYEEAEEQLVRLREIDTDGGFVSRAEFLLSAFRGDLPLGSQARQDAINEMSSMPFALGTVYLILGDIEMGLKYWRSLPPAFGETVGRFTVFTEQFFDAAVVADPRFQQYLMDTGIGQGWTAFMREKVADLAPITGIAPTDATPQLAFSQ